MVRAKRNLDCTKQCDCCIPQQLSVTSLQPFVSGSQQSLLAWPQEVMVKQTYTWIVNSSRYCLLSSHQSSFLLYLSYLILICISCFFLSPFCFSLSRFLVLFSLLVLSFQDIPVLPSFYLLSPCAPPLPPVLYLSYEHPSSLCSPSSLHLRISPVVYASLVSAITASLCI